MTDRLWILGASDPEMAAIETLLRECGETVAYAVIGADRVHPGSAYRADAIRYATDCGAAGEAETWYLVECQVPVPAGATAVTIDHHRAGDPGYGRSPREFFAASSLGQVISELGQVADYPSSWTRVAVSRHPHWCGAQETLSDGQVAVRTTSRDGDPGADDDREATAAIIPPDLVLCAAADHCLGAAYRGECPGVDPDELMRWRAASRAAFQRRSVAVVLADIERAQEMLRKAPLLGLRLVCLACARAAGIQLGDREALLHSAQPDCGHDYLGFPFCQVGGRQHSAFETCEIHDMRSDAPIRELADAATRLGIGYVSGPLTGPDGRRKYTVSGSAEQVSAWFDWAAREGLVDAYGDPARGFAGAYEPEVSHV